MSSPTVLIPETDIQKRVKEMGHQIRKDAGDQTILLLGVLKGAYPFLADLAREIEGDVKVDFVQISSYGDERSSSGVVRFKKDHDVSIEGEYVVVVEDIIDSGLTITHLRELLLTRKPKSLKVASMLNKSIGRELQPTVEYVGFDIPNRYVVGYGLDDAEKYRNLRYIGVLD